MLLCGFVVKNITHHSPASVDYFGGLMKKADRKLHELILIAELSSK